MHKLLLADDSVTIQRVIELTFSGEDIQVIAVSDGEQAIARIPIERPDIVLADIGMPKRTGYDVAAFVKGTPELAHIPVLLLAGAFERVDEARAEQVKCDGVLVKPFEPRHVVARVRELVAGTKATPLRVAADVPRPAERLALPQVVEIPPPLVESRVDLPAPSEPAAASFLDASLDDYFEKLNSAFEEVRKPAPGSALPETSDETARVSDSLDGYFDRLSAAFADLATPLHDSDVPPASFDELLSDEPIPTVTMLVGEGGGDVHTPEPISSLPTLTAPPLEPHEGLSSRAPAPGPMGDRHDAQDENVDGIADVLSALLAERGEFGEPSALPVSRAGVSPEPVGHDALVEEVARRVLDRLVPEVAASLRRLVVDELAKVGSRR